MFSQVQLESTSPWLHLVEEIRHSKQMGSFQDGVEGRCQNLRDRDRTPSSGRNMGDDWPLSGSPLKVDIHLTN